MSTSQVLPTRRPRQYKFAALIGISGIAVGFALAAFIFTRRTPQTLSSRELSISLGLHHWSFTIPENDGTKVLTFEIRDGDSVRTSGGATSWKTGEKVTVTVRSLMDSKKLEASIIGSATHDRFLLPNPFPGLNSLHYTPDGESVNELPLIKGNHYGEIQIVPANQRKPGDVELRLVMKTE